MDLLNPDSIRDSYRHQIQQFIDAYSVIHIVIAEALQNSLDAIAKRGNNNGRIDVHIDCDQNQITVTDNGVGFPNNSKLLILGGSDKQQSSRSTAGMVGVGIKISLFCSTAFSIRSYDGNNPWSVELIDGCRFNEEEFSLEIVEPFQNPLPALEQRGTEINYTLSRENADHLKEFFMRIYESSLAEGRNETGSFLSTVRQANQNQCLQKLIECFLKRFTYLGDTLACLGGRTTEIANTTVNFNISCANPEERFGDSISSVWGQSPTMDFSFSPKYLTVQDTVRFVTVQRPGIFNDPVGNGGNSLEPTSNGFNHLDYGDDSGYERLLRNRNGQLPDNIDHYRTRLFPHINCISLTIGRIPKFEALLPGSARRIISCNGVVTEHDLPITSGQNQQYVRCLDFVIDLDAELNLGKTHLKNGYLVSLAKSFVNDCYKTTLHKACSLFVGRIDPRDDDEPSDTFWERSDINLNDSHLIKIPSDENDVIALFVSLVEKSRILGVKIYGFSQSDQYDSRMLLTRESDREDLLTNPNSNDLRKVEFKLKASSIVRDFLTNGKDPSEIHLLVCWELGTIDTPRFTIDPITASAAFQDNPKRVFSSANFVMSDTRTGRQMQCLSLKDYLENE